jgi:hypothetical protein
VVDMEPFKRWDMPHKHHHKARAVNSCAWPVSVITIHGGGKA